MATVTLNPVFTSMSGTVCGMVFYRRNGRTISRIWIKPPNPKTAAQQKNRSRFRDAMKSWQGLSPESKAMYNSSAAHQGMTGHNLFIRKYMKHDWPGNSEKPDASTCIPHDDALGNTPAVAPKFALSTGVSGDQKIALSNTPEAMDTKSPGVAPITPYDRNSDSFPVHPEHRSVTAPSMAGKRYILAGKDTQCIVSPPADKIF